MKRLFGVTVMLGIVMSGLGTLNTANATTMVVLPACTAAECATCERSHLTCKYDGGTCYCV